MRRERRVNPEIADWILTPDRIIWLAAGMALVLVPHALRMPLWVSAAFALLGGWRIANVVRGFPLPPRWLFAIGCLATLPAVYASYGTFFGRDVGVALLTILAGMKLLEIRTLRDAFVTTFLAYFLVITNFLYSQSIPTGLYMLAVVVVLTATLIALVMRADEVSGFARLRIAGVVIVQAVPLMLVLFVLFPRVPGPLWGLPKDSHSGVSGLDNRMSPGTISDLSLSYEVAFRVAFDGPAPPPWQQYWRGPVLWRTDGKNWVAGTQGVRREIRNVEARGDPVDYVVTLEPHQRKWIFALDAPTTLPPTTVVTEDLQILASRPVRERIRYRARSYPDYRLTGLDDALREAALQLAGAAHPRTRALARSWRAESDDPAAIAERALTYFREREFFYTLSPARLDSDTVDQFLFDSRRGFCEHYAAAFVVLMRAAGVPARVVTGYQGGEFNSVGNYLVVRQSDAHAWAEIWLDEHGWVRYDPTAAVAPERIERGVDAAIPPTFGPRALGITPSAPVLEAWRRIRERFDAVDNAWNQWVLGYGASRQREFLARFGVDASDYRQLTAWLAGAIAALFVVVMAWTLRRRREDDPVVRAYRRFCRRLSTLGLERGPSEGPMDFARRVARARPDLADEVERIITLYVALRYAGTTDIRDFAASVARFHPNRGPAPRIASAGSGSL